jgi:hypothetical protein
VDGSFCADTTLIVSWLLGARDMDAALAFTHDLESRLANRVQLTSDGHRPYLQAVEAAFVHSAPVFVRREPTESD